MHTPSTWPAATTAGRCASSSAWAPERPPGQHLDAAAQAPLHPLQAAPVRADQDRPGGFAQQRQVAGAVAVDGGEGRADAGPGQGVELARADRVLDADV